MNKRTLNVLADDYFQYLGRYLPQQCANDEFYFFPRSETAIQHLNILDDLRPEKVQDHIRHVRNLLKEIPSEESEDLEEEMDRLFLMQSMKSFIREYADAKVWRIDPTIYIKIPLFAVDRALSHIDLSRDLLKRDLLMVFSQIPGFLSLAVKNFHALSEISIQVAMDMAQDAFQFHSHNIRTFIREEIGEDEELTNKNREILEAWERFKNELAQVPARRSFAIGEDGLKKILSVSLSYPKSPDEILDAAQHAYSHTREKLCALARKIDNRKTWLRIIYENTPSVSSTTEIMQIYQKEVEGLRGFLTSQDILSFPPGEEVRVLKTPSYLQSLRATASYASPLTGQTGDRGIFYITPGKEDLGLMASHCSYLSAHETYPGHHILDHLRIHHPNPIRRQIESPLFYEGWACYAEHLLDELGYVKDPRQQLIGLQRRLWRNLRAILDIELQTRRTTLDQAANKIEALGFPRNRAQRQVRRFCLTPGYQLCYSVGMQEILRLRKRFSFQMPLKTFHDTLLSLGQISFHLAERRLEAE
ncbi:MAG: DUF885 family protein [Thermodesulfobacteriota bacterium]|nr:DUF885 family protein [Thermodesulfobacteriota bacterium]